MDGACQHLSLVLICGGIILNLKTVLKIYICIFLAMDILAYFGHHYGTVSLTYGPFLYKWTVKIFTRIVVYDLD